MRTLLPRRSCARGGFTIAEVMVALGILAIALTLVTQVGVQSLHERVRSTTEQAAQELAANVLESARARPWKDLTPDWAGKQRLPESYQGRGWRLTVRVEPEPRRPEVKRVTVEVRWAAPDGSPTAPAQLVGLFSARSAGKSGERQ